MQFIHNIKGVVLAVFFLAFSACGSEQEVQQANEEDRVIVQKFHFEDLPLIGEFEGVKVFEGGFSGLHYIPGSDMEFYAINDRGPNVKANKHPLADGADAKLMPFADYKQKIFRLKLDDEFVRVLDQWEVVVGEQSVSGLAPDYDHVKQRELMWGGEALDTLHPDPIGMDMEGIALGKDGDVWVCEEYRPAILRLDAETKRVKQVFAPTDLPFADTVTLDTVVLYRRTNRGFEGITSTPNGNIYTIFQSPLAIPDKKAGKKTQILRILEINPETNEQNWYLYEMEKAYGDIRQKDWKVGSIAAINNNEFLVLEHAQRKGDNSKYLMKINLADATRLSTGGSQAYEKYLNQDGLNMIGTEIRVVEKELFLDLREHGWDEALEKAEGIAVIDSRTIAVINDNDYAVDSPDKDGKLVNTGDPSVLFLIRLPESKKLNL